MTYVARNTGITVDWQAYTPTVANLGAGGSATNLGYYRRVGDSIEVRVQWKKDGTAGTGSANPSWTLPSGIVVDTTKVLTAGVAQVSGYGFTYAVEAASQIQTVCAIVNNSTGNDRFLLADNGTGTFYTGADFRAGAEVSVTLVLPVVGWTSNVLQADRALEEYASNFDSSNAASNTTSFAYGPDGSQMPIGTIGTTFNRTAQFLTPIQPTDRLVLEFSLDQNSTWVTPESRGLGYNQQGSVGYGVSMIATGASTVLVSFQGGGYTPNNGVYGTNGSAPWSAAGWKWRVRKVSGGASVGFPLSGKNIIPEETIQPPLVSSTSLAFGVGVRLVNSGSPTTQTLPTITAADDGRRIVVKNIGVGTVTVATSGGSLVDGQSTQALNQYECANLMAYNSNWFIV